MLFLTADRRPAIRRGGAEDSLIGFCHRWLIRGAFVRIFNVQLGAILFMVGIVLSSSFYLVHKYQIRHNAYAFMRQADRWEELAEQATKKNDFKQDITLPERRASTSRPMCFCCRTIWMCWKSSACFWPISRKAFAGESMPTACWNTCCARSRNG